MSTQQEKFKAIADKIRGHLGTDEPIAPDDFVTKVDEVYEAGKQAQYDEFWDTYQAPMLDGKNVPYMFAGSCWNGDTFYPKYDIKPHYGMGLFNYFSWDVVPWIDLAQRLEECGVILDTSETLTSLMFSQCFVTRIPKIDATYTNSLDRTFRSTTASIIDELVLKADGTNTFSDTFRGCSYLEEIRITGIIGQNGFSVSDSTRLSYDSLMSIVNALKDYSADTSGASWVVTLGATNLAKLTNEEKAIATQKGWSLA